MHAVFFTANDLRPTHPGWAVRQFHDLRDAITHYRTLPMSGSRVLGMMEKDRVYELLRCVELSPSGQREDVLACWPEASAPEPLKAALELCRTELNPRYLLEPGWAVPIPGQTLREDLRGKLLWRGYGGNYHAAVCSVYLAGVGWVPPQDVKKYGPLPLILSCQADGRTPEGEYLSLELEPWEFQRLLKASREHDEMKK